MTRVPPSIHEYMGTGGRSQIQRNIGTYAASRANDGGAQSNARVRGRPAANLLLVGIGCPLAQPVKLDGGARGLRPQFFKAVKILAGNAHRPLFVASLQCQ